jgi:hypothetical protein
MVFLQKLRIPKDVVFSIRVMQILNTNNCTRINTVWYLKKLIIFSSKVPYTNFCP